MVRGGVKGRHRYASGVRAGALRQVGLQVAPRNNFAYLEDVPRVWDKKRDPALRPAPRAAGRWRGNHPGARKKTAPHGGVGVGPVRFLDGDDSACEEKLIELLELSDAPSRVRRAQPAYIPGREAGGRRLSRGLERLDKRGARHPVGEVAPTRPTRGRTTLKDAPERTWGANAMQPGGEVAMEEGFDGPPRGRPSRAKWEVPRGVAKHAREGQADGGHGRPRHLPPGGLRAGPQPGGVARGPTWLRDHLGPQEWG